MPNVFDRKKRTKRFLVKKIFQEKPIILSRNPRKFTKCEESFQESCQEIRGKPKTKREKARVVRNVLDDHS